MEDRHVFKAPRVANVANVALTAPDPGAGSDTTLGMAVMVMGRCQSGERLSEKDDEQIVQFPKMLTGEDEGKTP